MKAGTLECWMNTSKNRQRGADNLIVPGNRILEATLVGKEAEIVDGTTREDNRHDHSQGLDPGRDPTLPAPDQALGPDLGHLHIAAVEATVLVMIEARGDQVEAEVAAEAAAEAVHLDAIAVVVAVSPLHHNRCEGLWALDRVQLSHLSIVLRSHKTLFFSSLL